jgi:hypothetical protein
LFDLLEEWKELDQRSLEVSEKVRGGCKRGTGAPERERGLSRLSPYHRPEMKRRYLFSLVALAAPS